MAGLILPQERPIRLEVSQCPWALWRQHAAVVLGKIDEALQAYRFHWVSPRSVSTVPQFLRSLKSPNSLYPRLSATPAFSRSVRQNKDAQRTCFVISRLRTAAGQLDHDAIS